MNKYYLILAFLIVSIYGRGASDQKDKESTEGVHSTNRVSLIHDQENKKVDVFIDDRLFTSYLYPETLKKPILYPLITPNGKTITRRYPLESSVGERIDNPYQVGVWFNYGSVNGYNFWNNSNLITKDKRNQYGTIKHQGVTAIKDGSREGKLKVLMNWVDYTGNVLLEERTSFVFGIDKNDYFIDRITKLTAVQENVFFKDTKEGMLGIRVSRELEHPATKAYKFTKVNGVSEKANLNNDGVNGKYINSNELEGLDCWGKRADWVNLTSLIDNERISLVIIDHPSNIGYPTYWHARGYGLFAANPLGQSVFSKGKEKLNLNLKKGEHVLFKYRIVLADRALSDDEIDLNFIEFSKK